MFNRAKAVAYMKERWLKEDKMQLALYEDSPMFGRLKKEANKVGGALMRLPLMNVRAQGRSANYAKAKLNVRGTDRKRFEVGYKNNYQLGQIEGDVMRDMNGDENALVEALDSEMKSVLTNLRIDMGFSVWGNGGAARGRVGAIGAGLAGANCRITLLSIADSRHFEKGMLLQASANDGSATGHALRGGVGIIEITGVNKALGYLEFASDVTVTVTGLVVNDYLFADGDFKEKITGVAGWIPAVDPTGGENFFTIDRSTNVQTLSGIRLDISTMPMEEGIVHGLAICGHHGALPKDIYVNPIRWGSVARSIGADAQNRRGQVKARDSEGREADVSYDTIKVFGPNGAADLLSDSGVDINAAYALTMDTWEYGYVMEIVGLIEDDGLTIRRGTGDDWIFEALARGNVGCTAPGKNARLALPALTL